MTPVRIAVTQPVASPDPRRNGEETRRLVRVAARRGARMVLLPEGHLGGYAKEQVADPDRVDREVVRGETGSVAALVGELGVDCLLLPTYPVDAVFRTKVQALAAINNFWVAACSVAQTRHLFASEVFGPDGSRRRRSAGLQVEHLAGVVDHQRSALDLRRRGCVEQAVLVE